MLTFFISGKRSDLSVVRFVLQVCEYATFYIDVHFVYFGHFL